MTQLTVEPDMYLNEIQTWVAVSHNVRISKGSLSKLIEDVGFSYKCLYKAAAERDEDKWEHFQEWVQEMLVPEMIVAIDESSKDDHTLYHNYRRSLSRMHATSNTQFIHGDWYSLIVAMSVDEYAATWVVNGSVNTTEFFDFIVSEVVSIPLCHMMLMLLTLYDSSP